MVRRLARNLVIALVALVAFALLARVLVAKLRPSPGGAPTWPPRSPATDLPTAQPATTVAGGTEGPTNAADETGGREAPEASDDEPVNDEAGDDTGTDDEGTDEAASDAGWVEPDGDSCPASHPIKAKLSSGIYHSPGGLNYERTKPDRCYVDGDAASADGLRPSKR